jgi:DNA-binding transcriptional ArsR family regulator
MKTLKALVMLSALSQETRLAVFRQLVEAGAEGMVVGEIGQALKVPPATLSFHLKELSHAGLIRSRQESRFIWYFANYESMNQLIAYLTQNCCRGQPEVCGIACTPETKAKPARRKKAAA